MVPFRVLLVEDDPDDIEIYETLFKSWKHPVEYVIARDGESALTILEGNKILPDFAIVDYRLPKSNGFEFIRSVKGSPRFSSVAITVISSLYQPEEDDELRAMGIPCFTKPKSFSVFAELLNSVFNDHKKF